MPATTTAVPASTELSGSVKAIVRQPIRPTVGSTRRPSVSADALAIA